MTVEFVDTNPSSHVHIGPHVPLGGFSPEVVTFMVNFKTALFLIASFVQIVMYICIWLKYIPMPEEDNEDIVSKNEVLLFFNG